MDEDIERRDFLGGVAVSLIGFETAREILNRDNYTLIDVFSQPYLMNNDPDNQGNSQAYQPEPQMPSEPEEPNLGNQQPPTPEEKTTTTDTEAQNTVTAEEDTNQDYTGERSENTDNEKRETTTENSAEENYEEPADTEVMYYDVLDYVSTEQLENQIVGIILTEKDRQNEEDYSDLFGRQRTQELGDVIYNEERDAILFRGPKAEKTIAYPITQEDISAEGKEWPDLIEHRENFYEFFGLDDIEETYKEWI